MMDTHMWIEENVHYKIILSGNLVSMQSELINIFIIKNFFAFLTLTFDWNKEI